MTKQQTVQVQTLLTGLGLYKGNIDGIAGPMTIGAIKLYQRANGLVDDGIAGRLTLASMFPLDEVQEPNAIVWDKFYIGAAKALEPGDIDRVAHDIGVEPRMLRAIVKIEAPRGPLDAQGRVTALYEPHIAYRMSNSSTRSRLVAAKIAYAKWGLIKYPKSSYDRIDMCSKIASEELAADATSWGMGQIMGFNAQSCGYLDAVSMVKAFAADAENQVAGMGAYILNNSALLRAIIRRDFDAIAEYWNGAAYRKHNYQGRLKSAYIEEGD